LQGRFVGAVIAEAVFAEAVFAEARTIITLRYVYEVSYFLITSKRHTAEIRFS
jgi:hypothetical protein